MTITWTSDPPKKSSINLHTVTHLCQFMTQNSKIWGGSKKKSNNFLTSQKSALFGPASGQLVTYSKTQTKVCRTSYSTQVYWLILDEISQCRVPFKLSQMCQKMEPLFSMPHWIPLSVSHPPKMVPQYSLGTCPPNTPSLSKVLSLHQEKNWFSEDTQFCQKYSNSPGFKSWHISKVVSRCHRRCLNLSWVQIWPKKSNGKCPKLPKRNSHVLCYKVVLKCKLKPPKKVKHKPKQSLKVTGNQIRVWK